MAKKKIGKKKGFICSKCGYKAHQLGGYAHCPLCIVCDRCEETVRKCTCIEGE